MACSYHLRKYPAVICWTSVHVAHLVFATIAILTVFPVALLHAIAKNEDDPDYRFLPKFNSSIITIKFLLVAISVLSTAPLATAIVTAGILISLYLANIVWQPCLGAGEIVNHIPPPPIFFFSIISLTLPTP